MFQFPARDAICGARREDWGLLTGNSYETHFLAGSGSSRQSLSFSMLLSRLIWPPLASLGARPLLSRPRVLYWHQLAAPAPPASCYSPTWRPDAKKGQDPMSWADQSEASGRRVTPGYKVNTCKHIAIGPVIIIIREEKENMMVTTMMSQVTRGHWSVLMSPRDHEIRAHIFQFSDL